MTLNESQKIWDAIRQTYVPDAIPIGWSSGDVIQAHILDELTRIRLLLTDLNKSHRPK